MCFTASPLECGAEETTPGRGETMSVDVLFWAGRWICTRVRPKRKEEEEEEEKEEGEVRRVLLDEK